MKILVPYDGSPASRAAVDEVARRPWPRGTEVCVAAVVEDPPSISLAEGGELYAPIMERWGERLREEAHRRVHRALERLEPHPDLEVGFELRRGSARETLLELVRERRTDLVVVGSQGIPGQPGLHIGSVWYVLATHAPCNVEIVRVGSRLAGDCVP